MKTAQKIAIILYQAVKGSTLDTAVGQRVYKTKMPAVKPGSTPSEAIAVNVITINDDQFQRGTANVNIYVPDITVNVGEAPELLPNDERLDALTDLALPIFEDVVLSSYRFSISNISGSIEEPEAKRHYVNLRIDFQFFPS